MSRTRALIVCAAFAMMRCGSEDPAATSALDAGERAFDERSLWVASYVADFSTDAPLEGVKVCDDASGHCVETDSFGAFVLDGLTPRTETAITYQLSGYRSVLQPLVTPSFSTTTRLGLLLFSIESERERADRAQDLWREAGRGELELSQERLDASAQIMFGVGSELGWGFDNGVHVALDPPSGEGPIYNSLPSLDVTLDLPPDGELTFAGIFMNVEPREEGYELVYSRDSGSDCTHYGGAHGGWPSQSGRTNAQRVPARPGFLTWYTHGFCAAP